MFPNKDSDAYIKSTGERSTLGQMIGSGGGGGSELPPHTVADAGKVLMVDDANKLIWGTVSGGGNQYSKSAVPIVKSEIETSLKGVTS